MRTVAKTLAKILSLFMLTVNTCYADAITLQVKQKGTGDPVADATVVLENSDSDAPDYAQTDQTGSVSFSNILYPERIKVIAAGYEPSVNVPHDRKSKYTIFITPQAFEGEVMEVSASRIVEKTSKISLSAQELKKTPGASGDPVKALTTLPGVIESGEYSSAVYLRGSNVDDNIFWINRAPVGYIYHFGGLYSTIHPELVEDINIFLGGFPVEYGNALGGVIDIKLRNPKNDRTHAYVDISTITSSFLLEGPVGSAEDGLRDSYFVAGRRSYIDVILSPSKFNSLDPEDDPDADKITLVPRFYDFQSLYHHNLEKGYLDTYIFAAGDEIRLDINASSKADPQLKGALNSKIEYQTIGQTWRQVWNRKWDHIMTLAYYHVKSKLRYGQDDNGKPFFVDAESHTYLWQPELMYHPKKDTTISFGAAASYIEVPLNLYSGRFPTENDINYDVTLQKKYRLNKTLYVNSTEPYIKYRKNWTKRFTTSFGVNYSNVSITDGYSHYELSPRLSVEYQATKATLLTASWGRYVQTPDASQIIKVIGNPALEVTEAEHRIIGVEHQINPLYSIKTEFYHKPMKSLVVSIDEKTPPDNFDNEGTGVAYGIDVFIKRKPVDKRIGWLSASWSKSERTNEITHVTRRFSGDQPWRFTAVWGQPFRGDSWKYWDWSMKMQLHSGSPYTPVTGRHREDATDPASRWIPEFGAHNGSRLPTYYKIDLRIGRSYLFNASKLVVYLDMQNITFHQNVDSLDYGDEYEDFNNPTVVTGMGFFPFFGVAYEF